jgi:hypothetical protein
MRSFMVSNTAMTNEPTLGAIFTASFFAGIAIVMLHFV